MLFDVDWLGEYEYWLVYILFFLIGTWWCLGCREHGCRLGRAFWSVSPEYDEEPVSRKYPQNSTYKSRRSLSGRSRLVVEKHRFNASQRLPRLQNVKTNPDSSRRGIEIEIILSNTTPRKHKNTEAKITTLTTINVDISPKPENSRRKLNLNQNTTFHKE